MVERDREGEMALTERLRERENTVDVYKDRSVDWQWDQVSE